MFTMLCIDFSDPQGQLNTVISGRISLKSKPIQVFMHVLISCKNEEGPIKNETCKSMGIFSDTLRQLTLQAMFGSG